MGIDLDIDTTLKSSAISSLVTLIDDYLSSSDKQERKKGILLSYWLQDYATFLNLEDRFDYTKLKRYERGDIIKVHLGYKIGSEHGGLHYCVVLDNNNSIRSPILTVIPLSSVKGPIDDNKVLEIERYNIWLGNELYIKLLHKQKIMSKYILDSCAEASKLQKIYLAEANSFKENILNGKITNKSEAQEKFSEIKRKCEEEENKLAKLENQERLLNKVLKEIGRMRQGSIALVSQITTVSKIRIYDPKTSIDVLSGIKLSPGNLDKINEKVEKLFIYKKCNKK